MNLHDDYNNAFPALVLAEETEEFYDLNVAYATKYKFKI